MSLAPPTPVPTGDAGVDELLLTHESALPPDMTPGGAEPPPAALTEEALASEELPGITRMGADALSPLDLDAVPALASASTPEKERLVRAARVVLCSVDVTLPPFALALVLEGEVAALAEDGAEICRAGQGEIVRTKGSFDQGDDSITHVVTAPDTTLALWTEGELTRALGGHMILEYELKKEGDRLVAWASVLRSSLGARLHVDVRRRLAERLAPLSLMPGDELVGAGASVPGILLVAAGTVVLDDGKQSLAPGDFVFPEQAMGAGKAKVAARAGESGAVVLSADRRATQELFATEPLLLELLASSF
jgi:hypothetical protein